MILNQIRNDSTAPDFSKSVERKGNNEKIQRTKWPRNFREVNVANCNFVAYLFNIVSVTNY